MRPPAENPIKRRTHRGIRSVVARERRTRRIVVSDVHFELGGGTSIHEETSFADTFAFRERVEGIHGCLSGPRETAFAAASPPAAGAAVASAGAAVAAVAAVPAAPAAPPAPLVAVAPAAAPPAFPRADANTSAVDVNVVVPALASPNGDKRSLFSEFSILHSNIRGFVSHRALLEGQLQLLQRRPTLVCLNETFLDESIGDGAVNLGGYVLVARRDRQDGRSGGGIAVFAAAAASAHITLCEHSVEYERSWLTIHSDICPLLCGVWYRPPTLGEVGSIVSCELEWRRLSSEHVTSILVGDLNVHHTRWLRHSSGVSVEGTSLYRFCTTNGLKQFVRDPTHRAGHTLDLVITDLQPSSVEILHAISDHNMILASFDVGIPETLAVTRKVWDYREADWSSIKSDLARSDWSFIDQATVDDAERFLHNSLFIILRRHIPERLLVERKSKHPWINERCLHAIQNRNATAGTPEAAAASIACSRLLFEEYLLYIQRMRDKLQKEQRGSKGWWRIANQIMEKQGNKASIPALKDATSAWVREPLGKANLLATTFSSKFCLPALVTNEFSFDWVKYTTDEFVVVHDSQVANTLSQMDIDSGTGPDGLATRVLKLCSEELGLPLAKLIRRIIAEGSWPEAWTIHWLMPLYKRKAVSNPENYRAINLTAQISKAVERFLCPWFGPLLEDRAFGQAQFAYRKRHGARDAVLYYVLSWIAEMNVGNKVGIYCSDVSGAFDRVDSVLLLRKLESFGLNAKLVSVIRSWLKQRQGFVIVNGEKSAPMRLADMVFQGTVWRPTLWNVYFGDCVCAISCCGFEAVIYADDCNAFRAFSRQISNDEVIEALMECQASLHSWGRANRVIFDAGKEETMVVSTVGGTGGPVKLLGIEFDNKLIMSTAAHKCATSAALRTKALLRSRRYYSTVDLVMLYKSHVLSFIEYRTAGIHFASTSVLREIDDAQARFLQQIDVSEVSAFMNFNLAPLNARRDIGMLGCIHRAALQQGPPPLWKFFRRTMRPSAASMRRGSRHSFQIMEWPPGRNLEIMRRSALGMIRVYNLLPQEVVDKADVKSFQSALTQMLRDRVNGGDEQWRWLFSPRYELFQSHPLLA